MGRTFTTTEQPVGRQLAWWQDVLSDVYYKVDVYSSHTDGLYGEIVEHDVGKLKVTCFSADNQRVLRTRAKIAADNDDSFVLVIPRRENLYFNQCGRNGYLPPGQYVLVQTKEFYELSCPDRFQNLTIKMPGSLVRQRMPYIEDHCACAFPNDPVMGPIVRDFVLWVLDHLEVMPEALTRQMEQQILDMVAALAEGEAGNGDASSMSNGAQLRRRIQRYVRDHLLDLDLSPSSVAAAFGISPSYLHRLFRPTGVALGRWIQQNRLQRGYELLTLRGGEHRSIAEIAYASGFTSHAHFATAFKRQFHVTPRDAQGLARNSFLIDRIGRRASAERPAGDGR